jgi:hypothetical protein
MKAVVIGLASTLLVLVAVMLIFPQELDRILQITRPRRASESRVVHLRPGESLQAALNKAEAGDTIILQSGATYTGPFTLPNKAGANYITIQSSRASELPAGVRVAPIQAHLMARLVSPGSGDVVMQTGTAAHHFKFIGIEFSPKDATAFVYTLVALGSAYSNQNTLATVPHDFIFDRCYLHGFPGQNIQRGIALNSAETSVLNSWISDIHGDIDTQALCGWNGPGPFHISNNHLEASGENVMFGGATVQIPGLIPSDIEIRHNHFFKPLTWRVGDPSYGGVHWSVKNHLELKNARRVVVDGNLFENCWGDAQTGFAVVLTPRQDPLATVEDVAFTNNLIRNAGGGVNLLGVDNYAPRPGSPRQHNITIRNNLFEQIGTEPLFQINGVVELTIDHNTCFHKGNIITAYGDPSPRFVFTNNIVEQNQYGIIGDGGVPLSTYFPSGLIRKNVIIGAGSGYPDNFTPAKVEDLKFVDPGKRDYALLAASPYKGKSTDRKDPGCDFALWRDMNLTTQARSLLGKSSWLTPIVKQC